MGQRLQVHCPLPFMQEAVHIMVNSSMKLPINAGAAASSCACRAMEQLCGRSAALGTTVVRRDLSAVQTMPNTAMSAAVATRVHRDWRALKPMACIGPLSQQNYSAVL